MQTPKARQPHPAKSFSSTELSSSFVVAALCDGNHIFVEQAEDLARGAHHGHGDVAFGAESPELPIEGKDLLDPLAEHTGLAGEDPLAGRAGDLVLEVLGEFLAVRDLAGVARSPIAIADER